MDFYFDTVQLVKYCESSKQPLNPDLVIQMLTLDPLKRALKSLERAISQPQDEFTRDSVIQRFGFTFELSWKSLKRYLELDKPLSDDSVKGILREAFQRQLIFDVETWFAFQKARNLTSHTYNEDTAVDVYKVALLLPARGHELIKPLEQRLSNA